ncbi:MAG: hypothetical protein DWQ04_12845 [Chloroflexi bacterium]|nr:MAG: hypothetical protein DWQ04_12845 [Chloroflexota bacterium]
MTENGNEWDYCDIKFQLRHKGEDPTRAGLKHMWLVFKANAAGANKNYLAGESSEIPIAANIMGASFVPQKNNASHLNIHQNLLNKLQNEGWERLPEKGSAWWETRLRRPASSRKSAFGWLKGSRNKSK